MNDVAALSSGVEVIAVVVPEVGDERWSQTQWFLWSCLLFLCAKVSIHSTFYSVLRGRYACGLYDDPYVK